MTTRVDRHNLEQTMIDTPSSAKQFKTKYYSSNGAHYDRLHVDPKDRARQGA